MAKSYIRWQYCKDPNEINEVIENYDENFDGLTSAEQIISITYNINHRCYEVFWRVERDA